MAKVLAAPAVVSAFERRYRGEHEREHALLLTVNGNLIAQATGDYDSVNFDAKDLDKARGGLLTHTHPRALAPSAADLAIAAEYGLTLRAVGNAPDTGQRFDHTIQFLTPSKQLAKQLVPAFDDAVERAEKQLAKLPFGDLQWQREARNLALTRLATEYGFTYQRTEHGALSEATRHERARLDVLSSVDRTIQQQVFDPLRVRLISVLARSANERGRIDISRLPFIQQTAARLVTQTFLGKPTHDGTLAPYSTVRGQVIPNSPYFATVLHLMRQGAQVAVERHAAMMRKYLPPDLVKQFEFATVSPFKTPASEMDEDETFQALEYDPLHLWVGEDGKKLSDRIWLVAGDVRRKLDTYLTGAIAQGKPVQQMAIDLEQFLQPSQGAYEAYRLARTETSAAINRADSAAAQLNPLVEMYTPHTSPRHADIDECDQQEAGGPYPKSDITHLPPFHPNCICTVFWHMVEDVPKVVTRLRDQIAQAVAQAKRSLVDYITPLSRRFIDLLFGR